MNDGKINIPRLILASESPRRRELLGAIGVAFTVMPTGADETLPANIEPDDAVRELARRKAAAAENAQTADALILAADTVVALDGDILGKPADEDDARKMIRRLSGRTHEVYTGVALRCGGYEIYDCEHTAVEFRAVAPAELDRYIESGEWRGKAGGYAIQGLGGLFVRRIDGDWPCVVGLPVFLTDQLMRRGFGLSLWDYIGK